MTDGTDPTSSIEVALARFHESQRETLRAVFETWGNRDSIVSYFGTMVVPQRVTAISIEDLPEEITRKCCPFKSCGNTYLMREITDGYERVEGDLYRRVKQVRYARENGESYFGSARLDVIVTELNDPEYFPVEEDAS